MQEVGNCTKCGAPVYQPMIWHGILPPPVSYSCNCHGGINKTFTNNNTGDWPFENPMTTPAEELVFTPVPIISHKFIPFPSLVNLREADEKLYHLETFEKYGTIDMVIKLLELGLIDGETVEKMTKGINEFLKQE